MSVLLVCKFYIYMYVITMTGELQNVMNILWLLFSYYEGSEYVENWNMCFFLWI